MMYFFSRKKISIVSGSRSPQRHLRSRDRFFHSYDQIDWGDRYQRAQELLADFEDLLLQLNGDFLAKEETFRSATPIGVHLEDIPLEFTYVIIIINNMLFSEIISVRLFDLDSSFD